ncbi:MAG: CDP-diacylglycerol--glycerol-3-phosphate 3-phosphatidyltransferase, partial [Paracoccaceae bacterium]|nr:CDP-diacylglycerol--glycerol-3-phosphate 3-phosphatidyltransferase [Paracoccaceae bacterium]
ILFSQGVFEHYLAMSALGLDQSTFQAILSGAESDSLGLRWKHQAMVWSGQIGLWLLWVAAALTFYTGLFYFTKALPFLRED